MIAAQAFGHLAGALAVALTILFAMRWIGSRSPAARTILACGVLLRALIGLLLFVIAYGDLPIAKSMHSADGFWFLAPDARTYYQAAVEAGDWGFGPIFEASAGYVRTLAVWLHIVGTSPAAGLYLNILILVLTSVVIVAMWTSGKRAWNEPSLLLCLGGLCLSPGLIIHSSQPLKDEFCAALLVIGCAGAFIVFGRARSESRGRDGRLALGMSAMAASMYLTMGVRPYDAFIFGAAYMLAAVVSFATAQRRIRALLVNGLAAALIWAAAATASWPYFRAVVTELTGPKVSISSVVANAIEMLRFRQVGFVRTGGGTNAAADIAAAEASDPTIRAAGRWKITKGLALIFVPVAVAQRLSLFELSSGRGLLWFADLDTCFLDAAIVLLVVFAVRHRSAVAANLPYFCFTIALAAITTLLLAYVVTNLGALLRLRLMAAVPIWMAFGVWASDASPSGVPAIEPCAG